MCICLAAKVGCASTMQEKEIFLAIVLGLHYLCDDKTDIC